MTAVAEPEVTDVTDAIADQTVEAPEAATKKKRKPRKKAPKAPKAELKADGTPKRKPGRPSKEELARRAAQATMVKPTGSGIELIVQLHGEIKALQAKYPADLFDQFVSIK